ncbi:DUF4274 domain-containing protein [Eikenella sp. S3360]|uniref:DUF4274 domain-containing protein n=1 Tax=Eikenella glucosivorans TaxID=2766967 RepID=A0ABS0NAU3_9NEIS|nr:DUF4274 domain-containing protein [Eikenella glucosivorans]MBH5329428.1 DUF4274 domain-containing protein [Eikenella glucosivorans]
MKTLTQLTAVQQQYIDDHFHENAAYTRAQFSQLTTPAELHYLQEQHNWDGDNTLLQWIAESPLCSRATALTMFWLSNPHNFQSQALDSNPNSNTDNQIFQLLQTIMANYTQGFYCETAHHFDPTPYCTESLIIPDSLSQPSQGEEPYLYWEESEVAELFGEELAAALRRCDRMDLYNIAILTPAYELPDRAWPICNHPLCDRAIAQLVFWRIRHQCHSLSDNAFCSEFIRRWQAGDWAQPHLAYHPQTDTTHQTPPVAWEIPAIMCQAV